MPGSAFRDEPAEFLEIDGFHDGGIKIAPHERVLKQVLVGKEGAHAAVKLHSVVPELAAPVLAVFRPYRPGIKAHGLSRRSRQTVSQAAGNKDARMMGLLPLNDGLCTHKSGS